jgi:APA family basic amino acid/polyamine antiporter
MRGDGATWHLNHFRVFVNLINTSGENFNTRRKMPHNDLKREMGVFSATALVVANMVGTGIFTTSGFISGELGSPQGLLLTWFVGGLFALSGALCYGELGAMFPEAGGEYVFLRESFGKATAFLSGWISMVVGFSAPIAAAAVAFATYLFQCFPINPTAGWILGWSAVPFLKVTSVELTAVAVIVLLSLVHYHSLLLGSRVQNALTVLKATFLSAFVVLGFLLGRGSTLHFSVTWDPCLLFKKEFAVSLVFVSFAYSGWNAAAYLGAEIKNPKSSIPLALACGTGIVTALYLLINVVYAWALPVSEMRGVLHIGAKASTALFGAGIGRYLSGAIAIGLLSVLSAMIMAGPRVYYAMSKDGIFFAVFARVREHHGTPGCAIFLQAVIAASMVLTASFETLLLYIGLTLSLSAMITVLGLMRLRMGRFRSRGAYGTLAYPLTPLFFVLGNLLIVSSAIYSKPATALSVFGTILLGLLFYAYFRRRKGN